MPGYYKEFNIRKGTRTARRGKSDLHDQAHDGYQDHDAPFIHSRPVEWIYRVFGAIEVNNVLGVVFQGTASGRNWCLDGRSRGNCLFTIHFLRFEERTDGSFIAMVHTVGLGRRSKMQCPSVMGHVELGRSPWRYVHFVIHCERDRRSPLRRNRR